MYQDVSFIFLQLLVSQQTCHNKISEKHSWTILTSIYIYYIVAVTHRHRMWGFVLSSTTHLLLVQVILHVALFTRGSVSFYFCPSLWRARAKKTSSQLIFACRLKLSVVKFGSVDFTIVPYILVSLTSRIWVCWFCYSTIHFGFIDFHATCNKTSRKFQAYRKCMKLLNWSWFHCQ